MKLILCVWISLTLILIANTKATNKPLMGFLGGKPLQIKISENVNMHIKELKML